jgi:adenylylsulfate kinase-like enzyme
MIYWFTGQPAAGKTTLAKHLLSYLSNTEKVIHIDGDDLRDIFQNKDYSETGRRRNIERAQDIARFMNEKGYSVVVSLVSPYKDQRDEFKKMNNVIEIYVHTTEIRGRETFHVTNYEPPTENFVDINTTNKRDDESFIDLIKFIDL